MGAGKVGPEVVHILLPVLEHIRHTGADRVITIVELPPIV